MCGPCRQRQVPRLPRRVRCRRQVRRARSRRLPVSNSSTGIMQAPNTTPALHYLNNGHGLKSWLLTKDHKRIALLYLITISVFFFLGGLMAVGVRVELATPAGDFMSADAYNKMFTLHGVI